MDTPKISIEKVQDETAPTAAGEDKIDTQQRNAMPAANPFLPLVPETAGGGNMSVSTNNATFYSSLSVVFWHYMLHNKQPTHSQLTHSHQTSDNPTDPVIELRAQRANASPDELDDEALELTQILRDYIFKASEVTGILAGYPEIIAPFRYDLSMFDATSSFLASMLGPATYGSVLPTEDQARRRTEIRNRCYRMINEMRRITAEQQQVDYAGQGGTASVQEAQAPRFTLSPSTGTRSMDPLAHGLSRILKFQLDGTGQEDSSSTQEEQDQLKVDGSGQGGSCPGKSNSVDDVD